MFAEGQASVRHTHITHRVCVKPCVFITAGQIQSTSISYRHSVGVCGSKSQRKAAKERMTVSVSVTPAPIHVIHRVYIHITPYIYISTPNQTCSVSSMANAKSFYLQYLVK